MLIVDLGAFSGMEMENMTRGHGWRFLDFGRRLERATHIARVLRGSLAAEVRTSAVLEPVLEIADSVMTYRRRYFAGAQLPAVLELLLMDEGNPRALAFQLKALTEHAAQLPRESHALSGFDEKQRLAALWARLRGADLTALTQAREAGMSAALDSLLSDVVTELGLVSNQLAHHYFSHTVARAS